MKRAYLMELTIFRDYFKQLLGIGRDDKFAQIMAAMGDAFFTPMFEKLVGAGWVRGMIRAGATDAEIRARWQEDVARFRPLRAKYLLYEE